MKNFILILALILGLGGSYSASYAQQLMFFNTGGNAPAVSFEPEYQSYLDYGTAQGYTLPSASLQASQNSFVIDLKTSGIWDSLDVFYFLATDGDSLMAMTNLVDPGNHNATVGAGSPIFDRRSGVRGDGATDYLDTNYSPATDGESFDLNSASFGAYYLGTENITSFDGAFLTGSHSVGLSPFRSNSTSGNINDDVGNSLTNGSEEGDGFFFINRSGATSRQLYKNGVSISSDSEPSTGLVTNNLFLLGRSNSGGSAEDLHTFTINIFFVGGDLSSFASTLNTHVQEYVTSVQTVVDESFDSSYRDYLTYGKNNSYSLPSDSVQLLQNTLVSDLKTSGVWDSLLVFYILATDNEAYDLSRVNVKDTSIYNALEVNGSSDVTYEALTGSRGVSNQSYLNTTFNPVGTWSVTADTEGASYGLYQYEAPASGNGLMGNSLSDSSIRTGGVSSIGNISTGTQSNTPGFHAVTTNARSASGNFRVKYFYNGSEIDQSSLQPVNKQYNWVNQSFSVHAEGSNTPSNGRISMAFVGYSLEGLFSSFTTDYEEYMDALGTGVIP